MSAVEEGKPLSTEGLFQLVCDEVFLDGVVEEFENKILQVLASFLGLQADKALEIAARSKARFEAGQFDEKRPLAPAVLYKKALYFICSDGEIDDDERRMLDGLRKLFKIKDDYHDELMAKMQEQFVGEDEQEPEKIIEPVVKQVVKALEMKEWNKCVRGFRDYRRLARRLAVATHLRSYLDGLCKLVETAANVTDAYNRQKTMGDTLRIVEDFGCKYVQNGESAALYADACRRLLFLFVKLNDREKASQLLTWQRSPIEKYSPDQQVERAVTALLLDYMRLIFESGDDPEASGPESPLVKLLRVIGKYYPSSESVEHVQSRFKDLTGIVLD